MQNTLPADKEGRRKSESRKRRGRSRKSVRGRVASRLRSRWLNLRTRPKCRNNNSLSRDADPPFRSTRPSLIRPEGSTPPNNFQQHYRVGPARQPGSQAGASAGSFGAARGQGASPPRVTHWTDGGLHVWTPLVAPGCPFVAHHGGGGIHPPPPVQGKGSERRRHRSAQPAAARPPLSSIRPPPRGNIWNPLRRSPHVVPLTDHASAPTPPPHAIAAFSLRPAGAQLPDRIEAWTMASSADSHAIVAGAGTPPSDSPRAANKAGGAAPWKPLASEAVPVVVAVGDPIIDADSWPALPGLASPPPPPAAKASLKAPPSPSTVSFCIRILPILSNTGPDLEISYRLMRLIFVGVGSVSGVGDVTGLIGQSWRSGCQS
jgi:hypothetical protein